jgi:endo-1,3-1,4-beta-glycanase ExoK
MKTPTSSRICRPSLKPVALLCLGLMAGAAQAATGTSFNDSFDSFNSSRWSTSDGWTNGAPFAVGWRGDHVVVGGGAVSLALDANPCAGNPAACSGQALAGGELRSNAFYGYGSYSTVMQAGAGSGVVNGFFTYTGPSDGKPWDEIDVEILGSDPTRLQLNYFVNGVGGHEYTVNLGFDASAAAHSYAFNWSGDAIRWYVDGSLVHSVTGGAGTPLPTHAGRIMGNLWAVDQSASGWAGSFASGTTASMQLNSIAYAAPVPEPGMVWMLGGGLAVLGWARRRRA